MTEAAGERAGLMLDTEPLMSVRAVSRTFGHGSTAVQAVREASFTIRRGALVALVGRSGSGKTTLLNIVGGLDALTSGEVLIGDRNITAMHARERTELRRQTISFIFQSFGLIPMLTAAENVGIPLRIAGTPRHVREERVRLMLSVVGLDGHAQQRPNELSGGQQQRVAIARALAGQPDLLIADEPTGQLDSETGRQIMRLLRTVVQSEGITALVATHDAALLELADEVLAIEDGRLTARVRPARGDRKDPAGGRPARSRAAADEPTRGGGVMRDHELRDPFEEWAEPLRATPAPAVAAPRSWIRRRTARTAAATGFALAVVGLVAGLLVAGGLVGSGKPGGPALQAQGSAYPAPPGQP
jgi:putative ABC transport system ATP-binding protein